MKTIGLIGGMSAESTALYYQIINREVNRRLGGNHSAQLLLHSVDFEDVVKLQQTGDWPAAAVLLAQCGRELEQIGAQVLVLCTNTMHKVASEIQAAVSVPLLHVIDTTAAAIQAQDLTCVALLGTRFTMSDGFYHQHMAQHGIQLLTPNESMQAEVQRIIFDELCLGRINTASQALFRQMVDGLYQQGAQGVIYGCTEIGLLLDAATSPLPVFDSTTLHALAAVDCALADEVAVQSMLGFEL